MMKLDGWIELTVVLLLAIIRLCQSQDNRCFLIGGGSAETFFVSENATVGSVIGVLRIVGDPSSGGDIALRLEANETVVSITAGSKNLTLIKPLDKEGLIGPSLVTTRITCERINNNATSKQLTLTVPVNVRVTDANDNSPVFRNASYSVNVSESAMIGSVVLSSILAVDADQPGPYSTVQYSILPGPHSDVLEFPNSLEGVLVLKKALDYEVDKEFKIAIRAQDQGHPAMYSDAVVTVRVSDADDQNPLFDQSRYWAHVPQPADKGMALEIRPEPMRAVDQDTGINASISWKWNGGGSEYRDFELDALSGTVTLARRLEDNELVQPVTLVVKAHQADNPDRYALCTLTVSRSGSFSPQLQYLQRRYAVQILENAPIHTTLLALAVNKPIDQNKIQFTMEADGPFSVDNKGEIKVVKELDYEKQTAYQLVVWATDGLTNDTAYVNVTVLDVNDWDPHFEQSEYEFMVTDSTLPVGSLVGRVQVEDGDAGDTISFQLKGSEARAFSINDEGSISFSDPTALNSTVVHLMVVAKDSGLPPRQASVPVKINLPVDFVMNEITLLPANSSGLLLIILGILLGILSLVISALAVYVCQNKRKKNSPGNNILVVEPQPKRSITELYSGPDSPSTMPATATLRRMPINPMARPSCRRIVPIQSPVPASLASPPPAPPMPPSPQTSRSADGRNNNKNNGNGQQQHQIAWPASLPRRVKKLSWEDEFNVFF